MSVEGGEERPIRRSKEALHDAIQAAANGAGVLDGALLTKWVVVAEFALTDGSQAMVSMSGTPDGIDLRSWERDGLLFSTLFNKGS